MTVSVSRRRPQRVDTERGEAIRACARHVMDLMRFHGSPPPDVRVMMRRTPRFVAPFPESSYCTSPAVLCAEIA